MGVNRAKFKNNVFFLKQHKSLNKKTGVLGAKVWWQSSFVYVFFWTLNKTIELILRVFYIMHYILYFIPTQSAFVSFHKKIRLVVKKYTSLFTEMWEKRPMITWFIDMFQMMYTMCSSNWERIRRFPQKKSVSFRRNIRLFFTETWKRGLSFFL